MPWKKKKTFDLQKLLCHFDESYVASLNPVEHVSSYDCLCAQCFTNERKINLIKLLLQRKYGKYDLVSSAVDKGL